MRKYIVTGGAGFIGSHLVEKLLTEHCEVIVLDDFSTGFREFLPDNDKLTILKLDISDWGALSKQFAYCKDADGIFHLAARARIQPSIYAPYRTHEINTTGTLNILELARLCNIRSLVYSASSSSYGANPSCPCVETAQADCQTPYAVTKYVGELYVKTWARLYGFKAVSLKYFNVYGRRSPLQGSYAPVIGRFFKQAILDQPLTIIGNGEQKRDFTHVGDVVKANILAMGKLNNSLNDINAMTFNIGTGKNYSINEIADLVEKVLTKAIRKKKVTRTNLPERIGETKETLADNNLAKNILGWIPEIGIESGMEDMAYYYLNNLEKFKEKNPVL